MSVSQSDSDTSKPETNQRASQLLQPFRQPEQQQQSLRVSASEPAGIDPGPAQQPIWVQPPAATTVGAPSGWFARETQLFVLVECNFEIRPHIHSCIPQYLQSFGGLAGLPNLAGNTNPLAANALFGGNGGNGNGGVITTSKPVIKVGWFVSSYNVFAGATYDKP